MGAFAYGNSVKIAVVGAGPAGLTAARILAANAHRPVVFEARDWIGGRTRTIRRDGHMVDVGAGWLASFYTETFRLLAEVGLDEALEQLDLAGASCLSDHGEIIDVPASASDAISTPLIPLSEKLRLVAWAAALLIRQPQANLKPDLRFDKIDADSHITRAIGPKAAERVFTPMVSAVFSDLSELSAALLRSWVRAGVGARFYALEGGMDSLWTRIAEELDVRTETPVRSISVGRGSGVDISTDIGASERFDACVVAAPITRMRTIIEGADLPHWLDDVRYAPHLRVYAAITGELERADIHPLESDEQVATVSRGPAGRLWGVIPEGHSAALVGSSGAWSHDLIGAPTATEQLWERAQEIDPTLFELSDAVVVESIRWDEAVPVMAPGHFARVKTFDQRPPLVFAGDWLVQPCIEGAVRSGISAAKHFGLA